MNVIEETMRCAASADKEGATRSGPPPALGRVYEATHNAVADDNAARRPDVTSSTDTDDELETGDAGLPAAGDVAMAAGVALSTLGQTPDRTEANTSDRSCEDSPIEQIELTGFAGDMFDISAETAANEIALSQATCAPVEAPQQFVLTLPETWWPSTQLVLERIGSDWLLSIRSRSVAVEQNLRSKAGVLVDRFTASGLGQLTMAKVSVWRGRIDGDKSP